MEHLNPIFQKRETSHLVKIKETKPKRKPRMDRCHNIKFPVTKAMSFKLKSLCKVYNESVPKDQSLSQTKFNTYLLRHGLSHLEKANWDIEYKDTKKYMHTMLKEYEYREIGGPHGLALQKECSDRKVVFIIITSVLKMLEEGVNWNEIIQRT